MRKLMFTLATVNFLCGILMLHYSNYFIAAIDFGAMLLLSFNLKPIK